MTKRLTRSAVVLGGLLLCVAILGLVMFAKKSVPDAKALESATSDIYFNGVPLKKIRSLGWPPREELEQAAVDFPTVGSCLAYDPAKAASLTIAWSRIGSDTEAEVCLSRVATRLGSPDKIVAWLGSHGFTNIKRRPFPRYGVSSQAAEQVGTEVHATWSLKNNGAMSRRGLVAPVMQKMLGHDVFVSIVMSEPSRHVSTQVVTNIL